MYKKLLLLFSLAILAAGCSEDVAGPDLTAPDSVTNFTSLREGTGDMLIQLAWDKNKAKDLAGYLLYRKQDTEISYVFLDTVLEESYFDTVSSYTSSYSYEIFAFDNSGNVSEGNRDAHSITSPDFYAPTPVDSINVVAINRGINRYCTVSWSCIDVDIEHFNLIKETATTKEVINVEGLYKQYVDTAVITNERYTYSVEAVDFATKKSLVNTTASDIVLSKPTLLSPSDTVVMGSVVSFIWDQVANATSYEFILNQDKDLVDTVVAAVIKDKMTFTLDLSTVSGIQSGMPMTWHVLTYSKEGGEINSSSDLKASFTYSK